MDMHTHENVSTVVKAVADTVLEVNKNSYAYLSGFLESTLVNAICALPDGRREAFLAELNDTAIQMVIRNKCPELFMNKE